MTATIEVGPEGNSRTFNVHRDLLSFYSGYFRHIFNSGIVEPSGGIIRLYSEEPDVFESFVKWLYTRRAHEEQITEHNDYQYYMFFVKLWILAARHDVPLLMNEMVDSLHQSVVTMWSLPREETIKEIHVNTPAGSILRRMVVDMFTSIGGPSMPDILKDHRDESISDFLLDLVKDYIADDERKPALGQKEYKALDICASFHVHDEEGVKCTKKRPRRSSDEMED